MKEGLFVLHTETDNLDFHIGYEFTQDPPQIEEGHGFHNVGSGVTFHGIRYVELVINGWGVDITDKLNKEQIRFFEDQITEL